MNDVKTLLHGAACAELLPPGQWIFCWMELGTMFIVFAEQNTHEFIQGHYNIEVGYWLKSSNHVD